MDVWPYRYGATTYWGISLLSRQINKIEIFIRAENHEPGISEVGHQIVGL